MAAEDLSPFWRNPDAAHRRDDMYLEAQGLRGIRTARWKMVHYANRPYGELYNIEHDPWERHNLWDDRSYDDVKLELQDRLINHLTALGGRSQMPWNVGAPEH